MTAPDALVMAIWRRGNAVAGHGALIFVADVRLSPPSGRCDRDRNAPSVKRRVAYTIARTAASRP